MSNRIYTTQFAVPAGTTIAAPLVQAVRLDDEQLDKVEIVIPEGHAGTTGISIRWSGVQIAPYIAGTWIVGNADKVTYEYSGEITAGGLSLAGYNLGIWQHTFYLRWFLSLLRQPSPVIIASPQLSDMPAPIDVAAIAALTGGGS